MRKLTTEEFIEKAKKIHGDKYDYSKVNYINAQTKIIIICNLHGEFLQTPNSHLNGSGCPHCCEINHKYTKEEFIKKAIQKHDNKYDYSKVNYINNSTKVCVICPEHGEFWITPANHLYGQGCFKCYHDSRKNNFKYNTEEIINKFKSVHNNIYDYSKTVYKGIATPVSIICPEHGEFLQLPTVHLQGCGCPKCGSINSGNYKRLTTEEFIEKAKKIHGDKYDYSKVDYIDYDTPVIIICKKHGEFLQTPDSHLQGKGCQSCSIRHSSYEEDIINFIKYNSNTKIEINTRQIIHPLELDVFLPEKNIGIEFNGIRWHTEEFGKDKNYHLNKLTECNKKDIKLIQIFEDEMILSKNIVISKLSHLLQLNNSKNKIYGRLVNIYEIENKIAKSFLNKNHIQGFAPSTIYLGAYYNGDLIGVMSFLKENKDNNWNLTRFATDIDYICCGVGGKLLKYFEVNYKPQQIKSFADRRWTIDVNNNIYTKLGFNLDKVIPPDYKYVKNNQMKRIHKFNLRKNNLIKKYNINPDLTENEITKELGYHKIWDCGLLKYVKKYND